MKESVSSKLCFQSCYCGDPIVSSKQKLRQLLQSIQHLKFRWKTVEVSSIKRFIIWRYLCRAIISNAAESLYRTKSHNIRASASAHKQIHPSHMLNNTRWPPVSEPKVNSAAIGMMIKTGESCQESAESRVCCFAAAGFSLNNKLEKLVGLNWRGLFKRNGFLAGQRHLRHDFPPCNIHINTFGSFVHVSASSSRWH